MSSFRAGFTVKPVTNGNDVVDRIDGDVGENGIWILNRTDGSNVAPELREEKQHRRTAQEKSGKN